MKKNSEKFARNSYDYLSILFITIIIIGFIISFSYILLEVAESIFTGRWYYYWTVRWSWKRGSCKDLAGDLGLLGKPSAWNFCASLMGARIKYALAQQLTIWDGRSPDVGWMNLYSLVCSRNLNSLYSELVLAICSVLQSIIGVSHRDRFRFSGCSIQHGFQFIYLVALWRREAQSNLTPRLRRLCICDRGSFRWEEFRTLRQCETLWRGNCCKSSTRSRGQTPGLRISSRTRSRPIATRQIPLRASSPRSFVILWRRATASLHWSSN